MKPYPLLFKPSLKKRIWGGSKIKEIFGYPGPCENIGEAWVVSDHPEGKSIIINGEFSGESLGVLLEKCPEWFANINLEKFPLLVKVLDANDNLSIQVHPDDQYAMRNENGASGKAECWYVIDSEPGAEIIFGHNAKNRSEFIQLSKENKWDQLLAPVPARAGDFFFIPSGTVHAMGKGILLLEVQQNSDITYRIYDYERKGLNGEKRDLHFEKAIEVIDFQSTGYKPKPYTVEEDFAITTLVSCNYFTVERWLIKSTHDLKLFKVFLLIFIVNGSGELIYNDGSILLTKGTSIMIPANMGECRIVGKIEAIISYI
ncbi:MAG: hypothetical protein VR68_03020 [Peptococcaceae bacterium BRH_c4a]|nr:MAG: hypothetical protein VR68_03020 [Peptococcaceae bacterium BRH_c4a]